jgi:signal transduction histidine kinase/ActR/RegA family two-component response regulator
VTVEPAFAVGEPDRLGASVTRQALDAQAALLPYALAAFAVCLPIFVWVGSHAPSPLPLTCSLAVFAIVWAAFYAAVNWLKHPQAENLDRRGRVQILAGLCWAVATAQMALFADEGGAARENLLLLSVAASAICIFFTAPWLPSLLIVGPAVAAGPLIVLYARADTKALADQGWGAIALTLALAMILNRILRRQFAMAAEREALIADRAGMVEAASRLAQSKSDLVSTLSHEIRNGLTGVVHVLAAAAGRGGRSAPSREQLAAALAAAHGLIEVLNTTLDSETAEAGRLAVDVKPFEPVGLVRDLVLLNRPHAAAKGLEIALHVDSELETASAGAALADAMRVRQILSNLLSNALKFTIRGRIEARIELAGGVLAIEVADTGPGLTPEELNDAFEPFHRVERTSAGTSGAGLGLSLSRRLARLMGGDLTAFSAPGVGSRFRLELPYDAGAAAEPVAEANEVTTPLRERRGLRILIAEDDALNAAMLRAILEQLGHQAVHAVDGARAVDLARICDFDLMMIDGRMPGLDGPQTIAAIRAQGGPASGPPIIAVIGGDAEEARECAEAGADAVLRKPVSVGAVARAVAEASAVDRPEAMRHVA